MKKISLKSIRTPSPRKGAGKKPVDNEIENETVSTGLSLPSSTCCIHDCLFCPCSRRDYCPCGYSANAGASLESPKRKSINFFHSIRRKLSNVKQHEQDPESHCNAPSNCRCYLNSNSQKSSCGSVCSRPDRSMPYRSKSAERPKSRGTQATPCQPKSTQVKKRSNTSSLPRKSRSHARQASRSRTLKVAGDLCDSDSDEEFVPGKNKRPVKDRLAVRSRTNVQSRTATHSRTAEKASSDQLNELTKPFDGYGHASSPKCNDLLVPDGLRSSQECRCSDKSSGASKSSSDGDMEDAPATLTRDLSVVPHYDKVKERDREPWSLTKELVKLAKHGWYWGPINRVEAEDKLTNQPDGAFLVRDSSDERYLLSLSFRSYGRTLHTRIEHCNGVFSFYAQPESEGYCSIVDLINHSMNDSQTGVFYYSRARDPGSPSFPVRLTKPVSRFSHVRSLQYLCRFVIRQTTRVDHIQKLPLPTSIKGWLQQKQY